MSNYTVTHALDMKSKVLGTLETDENDVIVKWSPVDPDDGGRFGIEVEEGETIGYCASHNRLYQFRPKGDKLAKALADARARMQPQEEVSKTVIRIYSEQSDELAGMVDVDPDGVITKIDGDSTPLGVEVGMSLADVLVSHREYRAEERPEDQTAPDPDADGDVDFVSSAAQVGEAVGVAMRASGLISKVEPDKQNVFGWAYVTHDKDGVVNVDKSGDFIDEVEEIEKSAYHYALTSRQGDADHTNQHGADMIESMVFTPEKIEKMGLPAGSVPLGWWLGFHVNDAATWERVKKGELKAFSIHGSGTRKAAD